MIAKRPQAKLCEGIIGIVAKREETHRGSAKALLIPDVTGDVLDR